MAMTTRIPCENWWKDFVLVVVLTLVSVATMTSRSADIPTQWSALHEKENQTILREETGLLPAKKQLILHVGPSKTATTSLQTDLTTYRDEIADDGYWYAGRYYDLWVNETDGSIHTKRGESKVLLEAHNMLKNCNKERRVDCCREFASELDSIVEHAGFRKIVISEEPFGNQWKAHGDWQAIREALGDEWDVTVLVGYRRFYSWWISAHFQRERTDRSHNGMNDVWVENGGRAKIPLFPTWWNGWTNSAYRHSSDVLRSIGDMFQVEIINLHDETFVSPTQMVLCDVLDTPKACQILSESPETILNTHGHVPSMFYDAIATAAAAKGLVDVESWTRPDVREFVRSYYEDELGLDAGDLPMVCPSDSDLQALLNMSLSIEATYLPQFATEGRVEEHKKSFWEENYCFVDTDQVLANNTWIDFFDTLEFNYENSSMGEGSQRAELLSDENDF